MCDNKYKKNRSLNISSQCIVGTLVQHFFKIKIYFNFQIVIFALLTELLVNQCMEAIIRKLW